MVYSANRKEFFRAERRKNVWTKHSSQWSYATHQLCMENPESPTSEFEAVFGISPGFYTACIAFSTQSSGCSLAATSLLVFSRTASTFTAASGLICAVIEKK